MQQDVVAEFFTCLVILIALLMALSVIAIPEVVSMIEANYSESSEAEFMDNASAVTGMLNESTSGSVTDTFLVVRL